MIPISEISKGDLFANPLFVNENLPGNIYQVERINEKERLLLVQAFSGDKCERVMGPFWKKSTDRMFSENWRYERNEGIHG